MKIDHDKFVNADPLAVSRATIAVANGLQDHPKEAQVLASAAFFLILCETLKVSAQDAFTTIKNLMAYDRTAHTPQFNAALDYIKGEIANV